MPTEHDYIDVRDLFASINPNGLDEKDLARDGASFVEPHTINDYHLFRAGYQAALEAQQGQGEPIMLTAVATLEEDGDGGLEPNWLLEGGTAELLAGMTLLVADNAPHLCDDDGSAKVYTHADPTNVAQLELEIEQLRFSLTMNDCASVEDDGVREENRELRAQLAEAQALLREVGDSGFMVDGQIMPSHEAVELQERVEAFVSASAEPSAPVEPLIPGHRLEAIDELLADADPQSDAVGVPASELRDLVSAVRSFQVRALTDGVPVEIDERAEFEQACRQAAIARGRELDPEALRRRADGSHVNPLTECGWWGWRARAALERKP